MPPVQENRIDTVLRNLQKSSFRSRFRLSNAERAYVRDKGLAVIRTHAGDFLQARIAPPLPKNDGRQTPMKGHPVFIAQHATATCCRGCLQKWHGIRRGAGLQDVELAYCIDLIMKWIEREMAEE